MDGLPFFWYLLLSLRGMRIDPPANVYQFESNGSPKNTTIY